MTLKHKLIGLTGTNGSGKGEAADFFKNHGYAYFSLSDIIRSALIEEGRALSRDNMIQKGNELRSEHGADVLARRVMDHVRGSAVIDSIRNPGEVGYFRRQESFILLAIDAPVDIRYERVKQRGRDESASSLQEFISKEEEEMTQSEKGQQLQECMHMADYRVTNEGSLDDFCKKLERFL
ncbi:MAG: AAA family ATPase [Candidatus Aminicenantes bacterium]|jgi:dephospho-CoA kinase